MAAVQSLIMLSRKDSFLFTVTRRTIQTLRCTTDLAQGQIGGVSIWVLPGTVRGHIGCMNPVTGH